MRRKKKIIFVVAAIILIAACAAVIILTRPLVQIGRALGRTLEPVSAGAVLSVYTDDYSIYSVDSWLDERALILHSEAFPIDEVYYPYTSDKTGSGLEDLLGKEGISSLDSFLQMYYAVCSGRIVKSDRNVLRNLRSLKFEKADSKELHIDNQSVICRGFTTHVTGDFLTGLGTGVSSIGKGMTVTFYLSKGYVAEIEIVSGSGDPVEILFEQNGKKISLNWQNDNELSLQFKADATALSEKSARDLSQMSEEELVSFVMRMVIRGSGLSF